MRFRLLNESTSVELKSKTLNFDLIYPHYDHFQENSFFLLLRLLECLHLAMAHYFVDLRLM